MDSPATGGPLAGWMVHNGVWGCWCTRRFARHARLQSASCAKRARITEDWPARAKITGAAYIIEHIVNGAKTIVLDLSRVLRQ